MFETIGYQCYKCRRLYAEDFKVRMIIIAMAAVFEGVIFLIPEEWFGGWHVLIAMILSLPLYIFAGGTYIFRLPYMVMDKLFSATMILAAFMFLPALLCIWMMKLLAIMLCAFGAAVAPLVLVPINGFLYRKFKMWEDEQRWAYFEGQYYE